MSSFDAYQEEFESNCNEVQTMISSLKSLSAADSGEKNSLSVKINDQFTSIHQSLKEMEIDARTYDKETRKKCTETIINNRDRVARLKEEYNSTMTNIDRSGLMGGKSGEDRRRMLDTNQKINDQNASIERAMKTVVETEVVAEETLVHLRENCEKIEGVQEKTSVFQGIMDTAGTTIRRMTRREKTWGFF